MSQKKVDAYKQQKANREQIIKKEKRILLLEKVLGVVVCLAVVGWIGFSVYGKVAGDSETAQKTTVLNTAALDEYVAGLSAEEQELEVDETDAADEAAEETTDAADEAAEATADAAADDTADEAADANAE